MKNKKILLVEDEIHIAEGIKLNLKKEGYLIDHASNGQIAISFWKENTYDLIVLDIMMPIRDGFSVLKEIRQKDRLIPILILSAKDQVEDKIKSFKEGVDDYLSKPFNLDEFILRIKRLLERSAWREKENIIDEFKFGENVINFESRFAKTFNGKIELTDQEVKVLRFFIKNKNKPVSRKDLLESAWGYDENTSTRTIDNFIVRFRKYFEKNPKKPEYFLSLRSVGYIFKIYD